MLAEMNSKEQTYRMEFGTYLPLRADGNMTLPSPDEAASAFYPTSPATAVVRFGGDGRQHREQRPVAG